MKDPDKMSGNKVNLMRMPFCIDWQKVASKIRLGTRIKQDDPD